MRHVDDRIVFILITEQQKAAQDAMVGQIGKKEWLSLQAALLKIPELITA